nr:Crp/Fnr family transcriptional regulator [Enterobacter cloacae]
MNLNKKKTINEGAFLLNQEEQMQHIWYVHEGILRAVNQSPTGTERVKEFYFPGEYCFLYLSWLTQCPARYSLQAVTKCVISALPLSFLDSAEGKALADKLLRQQVTYKEKKEEMLLLHTPSQRYLYLQTHFPEWQRHLTQRDLANYIGVSPVSLSRIRHRINKG